MIKRLRENKRNRNLIYPLIKMDALDVVGLKLEMEITHEIVIDDIQTFVIESACKVLGLDDYQYMDGKFANGIGTLNYVCTAVEGSKALETYYMNVCGEEIERYRDDHKRVVQYNVYLEA